MTRFIRAAREGLFSMWFTIACLAALMVLVVGCTLAQIPLGAYGAVKVFIKSFWIYWPYASSWNIPIFPGGALVGLLLAVNVVGVEFLRLERSRRKAGLWITHLGLGMLFFSEFASGMFQVDSEMALQEGATRNYAVSARERELVLIDATAGAYDEVYSVPARLLGQKRTIKDARLPFAIRIQDYAAQPAPPDAQAEFGKLSATVELTEGDAVVGSWALSSEQREPQTFVRANKTYRLALRPTRRYLPFSLTLEKFRHDVYPGTDIPKAFSSLVRLRDKARGEDRRVLISMNNPLRYAGKAFYQASFGENDTLSVLQVVENPGWLLPYLSCILVGLGLLIHFLGRLAPSIRRSMP